MTIARHVMHLLSGIFSPADNGKLWRDKFLLSYAERERSCLGKWPVPPAERKGGIAAGRQQADTASLNVSLPCPPPSSSLSISLSLFTFSPPLQYLLSEFIREQEAALPAPPPCHSISTPEEERERRGEGAVGT